MAEVNEAKKIELENKLREHVEKDQRLGKKELQKKQELRSDIAGRMESKYSKMRHQIGVDTFDIETDSDKEVESDFRKLRPNANYKLDDVLKGRVRDVGRRIIRSKLPPEVAFMNEKRLEAGIENSSKGPKTARGLASLNKRERALRRAGFFNRPPSATQVEHANNDTSMKIQDQ